MLNNNNYGLQNALKEFQGWCDIKGINSHTFMNTILDFKPNTSQNVLPKIELEGLNKVFEITKSVQDSMYEFKTFSGIADNKILDLSKTFDQLYAHGYTPSAAEQKIIDSVDALLSETEKNSAISSKKPLSAVIDQVNMSAQKLEHQTELLQIEKRKEKAILQEKEQDNKPVKDDKMHGLGDEYSVVMQIEKSIREKSVLDKGMREIANEFRQSSQPEKTFSSKSPVEIVALNSPQISSKNMGIDKNNISEKEKGEGLKRG